MNDFKHFELHFQPEHRVCYEESEDHWPNVSWEELATCGGVKRIHYNTSNYINYVIVDVDEHTQDFWRDTHLPTPNIKVSNKHEGGYHLFWFLDRTITHSYYKSIWRKVNLDFTFKSFGDLENKGYVGKFINNKKDFNVEILNKKPYNITELYDYVDDVGTLPISKKVDDVGTLPTSKKVDDVGTLPTFKLNAPVGERNNSIFNNARKFAYSQIVISANNDDFTTIVQNYTQKLNKGLTEPLNDSEINATVKSITNYCIKYKNIIKSSEFKNRGAAKVDKNLTTKEKQSAGAKYTNKVQTNKTELKIKIAIIEMKKKSLKINISTVANFTKITRKTVMKYRDFLV